MRKLLMASAAILGASGGLALAQTANPNQGQLAAPYGAGPAANNNNNAWGTANTPTGSTAAGPLSTIYAPNVDAVPAPGTIVIRLNGRVESDVVANFTSADRGINPSATGGSPNGFKINPVGVATYLRLYPGFDGLAANGLRYGASAEIRTAYFAGTLTPATGGTASGLNGSSSAFVGTGSQSSASGNTSAETLFVRRVFTYLAGDQAGIVRIGQTDGVVGLFDNCVFSSSCWDAGVGVFQGAFTATTAIGASGGGGTSWPWLAQAGNEYGNAKIVYLSPQVFGFDFGVQYAPSMGNAYSDNTQTNPLSPTICNQASATCISVTSGDDAQRWYNQVGVGARFQQTFGPVDVKAYGFYETAGKEDWTNNGGSTTSLSALKAIAAAPGTQAFRSGANANFYNYDNLSFYQAGIAITAANFTAAVSYIGGRYDGQMSMDPTGGAPENALLYGLTYANGPITAGIDLGVIDSQGATQLVDTSQRHEVEFAVGGAYRLAPGVQLVGEYQYIQRHQGGFDFNTGALGTSSPSGLPGSSTRDAHGQGLLFSTVMTW
jgi:hypothetical protein